MGYGETRSSQDARKRRADRERERLAKRRAGNTREEPKERPSPRGRGASKPATGAEKRGPRNQAFVGPKGSRTGTTYRDAMDPGKNAAARRAKAEKPRKAAASSSKKPESFGAAFKRNRAAGKKTFTWKGKLYNTKTKEDAKRASAKKSSAKEAPVAKKKATAKKETPTQRYRRLRRTKSGRVR